MSHRPLDRPPETDNPASVHPRPCADAFDVVIEIPKGSFLKRGSTGRIDFISPLPCPFNYGSIPQYLGLEGDLLDALVLGPRLPRGTRIRLVAWGAVTLADRGLIDDKLICATQRPSEAECARVLAFFRLYARCKSVLNMLRGQPGRNACDGWIEVRQALGRARLRRPDWPGPAVGF